MLEKYEKEEMMLKWNQYHFFGYQDLLHETDKLKETYPKDILQIEEIGKSYDDRKILLFSIGTGAKKILMTAGVHGREIVNTIVCMRIIENYCKELVKENEILKNYTFHIIPLLNPMDI